MTGDLDVFVMFGLLVVAVIGASKRRSIPWGTGWVWPVPPMRLPNGVTYPAVISQEWKPNGVHAGVDVMYRRNSPTDMPSLPAKSAGGTTMFFAPKGTPVVAARDARVWSVDKSPRGWEIVLDHGAPFATYYQHLDATTLEPHAKGVRISDGSVTTVKAGEQLGTMGGDPLDNPQHLRHLHFAVWFEGAGDAASVDPAEAMQAWTHAAPWSAP